jgi:uncharacterized protein
MNRNRASAPGPSPQLPWWRQPMVWLVVGGPALVVVAALVTAVIAFRGADPVVREPTPPQAAGGAGLPAVQARNQGAATGSVKP